MKNILLAISAAATVAATAHAGRPAPAPARAPAPIGTEVRIPFVNFGGIRSFETWSDRLVYLEDRNRNWYRADLYGPCFGLDAAFRIGIDSHGSSTFDRDSRLVVGRETCPIESLTRSEKPQKPWKNKKRG